MFRLFCNGKKILRIEKDDAGILFVFEDGSKLRVIAHGDDCSERYFRLPEGYCTNVECCFFASRGCDKCCGTFCWIKEGNGEEPYDEQPNEDDWSSFSKNCRGMIIVGVRQGDEKTLDGDYTKKATDLTLTMKDENGCLHERRIELVNVSDSYYYNAWFDVRSC